MLKTLAEPTSTRQVGACARRASSYVRIAINIIASKLHMYKLAVTGGGRPDLWNRLCMSSSYVLYMCATVLCQMNIGREPSVFFFTEVWFEMREVSR